MTDRYILVVSHTARPEAIEATVAAVAKLRSAGIVPVMTASDRTEFAPHLSAELIAELDAEVAVERIEVALVLGGDGTILRAAELLRGSDCPILGVNLGHVGFLAEAESHDLSFTLERVLAGEYTVEERMTLEVCAYVPGSAEGAGEREVITRTWAVNEASVEKRGRMLEVAMGVDGRPLSSFGCDGVVLATPTGSTAYSFSAGGPVVWPGVQALLAVPLAAHALFNRPLVVGPQSVLTVEILPQSGGLGVLWCDGRRRTELPVGAVVEVKRSELPLRLARIDEAVFTDRLVNKFHLPVTGWRGEPGAAQ
ncbi:NAD kinase [Leucobacter sp. UT-8R-CII-1-4]|uniref:NAD kinase n=1 Tax=Leucobacter sp. UT-8R-CII-1-4 TaxID=3040075 RepID=UPI0024A82420|nr:NAD kinase [Leucobacter sp. UT-8R-CII-1-4]MDI6023350.1 NAD kinase [Leucobacter sp. UT-8R-CII-1-4]